jgi:hypothetical protein
MPERNRAKLSKIGMAVAAFGVCFGMVGYQMAAVRHGPRRVAPDTSPSLDEVRRLANSLAPAGAETGAELPKGSSAALFPLERRGGFVALPSGPAQERSGGPARVRSSARKEPVRRVTPNRTASTASPFTKNARSSITRALNEKFYSATNIRFSPRIKAANAGRAVVRTTSYGHKGPG